MTFFASRAELTSPHRLSTLQLFITHFHSIVAFWWAICNSGGHINPHTSVVVVSMPIGWERKQTPQHERRVWSALFPSRLPYHSFVHLNLPRPSVWELLYLATVVAFHHP